MEDNQEVQYISADAFDKIWRKPTGKGWLATCSQVLRDLKVDEAIVLPCAEGCWTSPNMNTCSSTTHVNYILGAGNYHTKHLEKRGTPNNHIAVKRIRDEQPKDGR